MDSKKLDKLRKEAFKGLIRPLTYAKKKSVSKQRINAMMKDSKNPLPIVEIDGVKFIDTIAIKEAEEQKKAIKQYKEGKSAVPKKESKNKPGFKIIE